MGKLTRTLSSWFSLSFLLTSICLCLSAPANPAVFFEQHCVKCHDAEVQKGNLDLTALKSDDLADAEKFARWVKIHDRIQSGEMPPKKEKRPDAGAVNAMVGELAKTLIVAERERLDHANRTSVRRMTRVEYEHTLRDLFHMPGIALQMMLPTDGSALGFDTNADALDVSHVNLSKYIEAADKTLDLAIAVQPEAPPVESVRLSLARNYHPDIMLMGGDAMLFRDKKIDPEFPPAGEYAHINQGAHESIGMFDRMSSVGVFRHEDESFSAYFQKFVVLHPGMYRAKASFWSLWWDKGQILPARGVEAARLSVVQFNENGRGGQHPSYVLGYYDAPSLESKIHELELWMNPKEAFGFNTASLAPVVLYRVGTWGQVNRTMGFTGPCIVSDWLDVEGPFHDVWPPHSHQVLLGERKLTEFKTAEQKSVRAPVRKPLKQEVIGADNRPAPIAGIWTVQPEHALAEADKLLASFLPKAFRRPVEASTRQGYLGLVETRLKAGDCFETAMRFAYRTALCSPDFLYHIEPAGQLDDFALASRLSYWLWRSQPDDELTALAAQGGLRDAKTLTAQFERLLKDKRAQRFIDDFLGQWLKLRSIAANDPDKKLYPEFNPYMQDSMVAETRAYFRELIEKNYDAGYLIKSDFAMLNEKLAVLYGIKGVSGPKIRRVKLPDGCERGGFLTQAAVLKVTANGTTTSPVPRGAFVMARLLGQPPDPPPPNVPAVEPDVQGATTIREMLDKHRNNAACAGCHAKIDPPGFALESFDVIGGFRDRYRSLNDKGEPAPRGSIDPKIPISFRLGPKVDATGAMADGRAFQDIRDFKDLVSQDKQRLLHNLARQLLIYTTGRDIAFGDRAALEEIVTRAEQKGGGIRTLMIEIAHSSLFQTR
jgi:hypothetical protein